MQIKEHFADLTIYQLLGHYWEYSDFIENSDRSKYRFWNPRQKEKRCQEFFKKSGNVPSLTLKNRKRIKNKRIE